MTDTEQGGGFDEQPGVAQTPVHGGTPLADAEEFVERAIESVLEQVPDVADEEPEGSAKLQPWAETVAPPSKNKRPLEELLEQYAARVAAAPDAVAGRPRGQHPVAAFFARFTPRGGGGGRGDGGGGAGGGDGAGAGRRRRRRGSGGGGGAGQAQPAAAAPAQGGGSRRERGGRGGRPGGGAAAPAAPQQPQAQGAEGARKRRRSGRGGRGRRRGGSGGGTPAQG